jgi:hypothetical protein
VGRPPGLLFQTPIALVAVVIGHAERGGTYLVPEALLGRAICLTCSYGVFYRPPKQTTWRRASLPLDGKSWCGVEGPHLRIRLKCPVLGSPRVTLKRKRSVIS